MDEKLYAHYLIHGQISPPSSLTFNCPRYEATPPPPPPTLVSSENMIRFLLLLRGGTKEGGRKRLLFLVKVKVITMRVIPLLLPPLGLDTEGKGVPIGTPKLRAFSLQLE